MFARALPLLTAALALTLLIPSTAAACWDGIAISSGQVSAVIADDDAQWSVAEAHRYATWIAQVEALLPEGVRVSYTFGGFEFEDDTNGACEIDEDEHYDGNADFAEMFDIVAHSCHSSKREIAAARAIEAPVYTVQLLSTANEEAARIAAISISESDESSGHGRDWRGFYEAGGFPSYNPFAHVQSATLDDGRVVYRVIVGAFVTAEAADATRVEIQQVLGRDGMVRRL